MLRPAVLHRAIDLAREAEFRLGDLLVDPARLTVSRGDRSMSVEPRVMMVMLVLSQAGGRVVSRGELVDRCWEGRVVGDNAVQRVISRIRHVAAELGGFEIETIPKVGYSIRPVATRATAGKAPSNDAPTNLAAANEPTAGDPTVLEPAVIDPATVEPTRDETPADGPNASALLATPANAMEGTSVPGAAPSGADETPRGRVLSRRRLIGGLGAGVVLAAGAAGVAVWGRRAWDDSDDELARQLIAKAREAALGTQREANAQAIAYLQRATELAPSSAEAWGELALAYQNRMELSGDRDLPPLAEWTRAAATRALAIDPDLATAKIALATIPPNLGRWAANERVLRELHASIPAHPALETALGWVLCDVGRWTEAIACFRRALEFEPFHRMNQLILGWALWGGGRLDETDRLLENALRLWPQDRAIWQSRFDFLVLTGRTAPALALVNDDDAQPVISPEHDPLPRDALRQFALALQSGAADDLERAAARVIEVRRSLGTYTVVPYLLALGRVDDAFDLLGTYFFGGPAWPPPGPLGRRKTAILFLSRSAPLRADARFGQLTRRLGLDDYWRRTGTRPDPGLMQAPKF